jgi:hypothetical protein
MVKCVQGNEYLLRDVKQQMMNPIAVDSLYHEMNKK